MNANERAMGLGLRTLRRFAGSRLIELRQLTPRVLRTRPGGAMLALSYTEAVKNQDLTWRPPRATGGRIALLVNGRRVVVGTDERLFEIGARPGAAVVIRPGAARDRHGNRNARELRFRLGRAQ